MRKEIENEIIKDVKAVFRKRTFVADKELRRIIEDKVRNGNYLKENWQIDYAVDRIKNEMKNFLNKDTKNTSGQGKESVLPAELEGWNWGAFLLSFYWGLSNKTNIAWLCLLPFIGTVMPFVLGNQGNEWAWQNKRWESTNHFQQVQKKWARWGVGVIFLQIIAGYLLWLYL
jgi:hypothetical protein